MYVINFFLFLSPAVQNKTEANSPTGSSVPLHDSSFDYTSHQLHDLQPGSTVCHVRKPKVSCAGEERGSWIYWECVRRLIGTGAAELQFRWSLLMVVLLTLWKFSTQSGFTCSKSAPLSFKNKSVQWWTKSQLLLIDIFWQRVVWSGWDLFTWSDGSSVWLDEKTSQRLATIAVMNGFFFPECRFLYTV